MDALRGEPRRAFTDSQVRLELRYTSPVENHNPMSIVRPSRSGLGDQLPLIDSTRLRGKKALESVRVIPPAREQWIRIEKDSWLHPTRAAIALLRVQRPVKLVLARQQMFAQMGHRLQLYSISGSQQSASIGKIGSDPFAACGKDMRFSAQVWRQLPLRSSFPGFSPCPVARRRFGRSAYGLARHWDWNVYISCCVGDRRATNFRVATGSEIGRYGPAICTGFGGLANLWVRWLSRAACCPEGRWHAA